MEILLEETNYLKDSITTISNVLDDTKIQFREDGLHIEAMDTTNVMMIVLHISKKSFTKYIIDKEESVVVKMEELKKTMRTIREKDMLSISVEPNHLKLVSKGKVTRRFTIPLLDVSIEDREVPAHLIWDVEASMPSNLFSDNMNDIISFSANTFFIVKDSKLILKGDQEQNIATNLDIFFKKKEDIVIKYLDARELSKEEIQSKLDPKNFQAKFNNTFLKHMTNASKISSKAYVYLRWNYPIQVKFEMKDRIMLKFILAPLVENN